MAKPVRTAVARPVVTVEAGRKVLRVDGVIQSVAVDDAYERDVWDAMLPECEPESALILGLGGGTIAALLTQRWGPVPITGVEVDPNVARLARYEFGLADLPHVRVEMADAFDYMRRCAHRHDLICVDLYTAGKMAHGVLASTFLCDVARCLTCEGMAVFNFWRTSYIADQMRRLRRELLVKRVVEVDDNVLVHCGKLDGVV
jgi:spermidine synthase